MTDPAAGNSASGFELLLARLHDDAAAADEAFERLRRTLVRFFGWRGVPVPEDAADETIDRVARRLAEGSAIGDVPDFALGVARMVLRESWRAGARFECLEDAEAQQLAAPPPHDEPDIVAQLERCLAELGNDGRTLVLDYYAGTAGRGKIDARRALARSLGLTHNALRSRVQRLRDRLEECVRSGLRAQGGRG